MPTRILLSIIAGLLMATAVSGATESEFVKRVARMEFQDQGHVSKLYSHHDGASHQNYDKNIGNEIIYQVFIDRFANGNQANDCLYDGRFCANGHPSDWYRYAGGDIRGLINRLDYLKHLGVSRLWLTPIFENQHAIVARDRHGQRNVEITSYHGYWIKDWYRLNPFFTDNGSQDYAIVDELLDRASPDIKIYLDSVTNHTSPTDATSWSLDYMQRSHPIPGQDASAQRGVVMRDGNYVGSYGQDSRERKLFHHNPTLKTEADWNDAWKVQHWSLDGLADLDQTNPEVQTYLKDAHAFWLERFPKLAGYRMDTIKHVSPWYWQKFSQDVFAQFPDAEVFGEYWSGGPFEAGSVDFYKSTRMSLLDFNFRDLMRYVFKENGSFSVLSMLWEQDAQIGDARSLVTFLDSHDVARLRGEGMSLTRMRQAIALWLAARGVPCIYYGMEQDLFAVGDAGDPYNRPMMHSFDENSAMFTFMQKLIALRKDNPALRYGDTHVVHETQNIFGFERIDGEHKVFFATSKNDRYGSDNFTMRGLSLPDGRYQDILSGAWHEVHGGSIDVKLKDGDIILLSTSQR